jgi:aspartate/methionine/tyrosine aminotransferase
MTEISNLMTGGFGAKDDVVFARRLVEEFGVAGVPGSSFYFDKSSGSSQMRFCFCKNYETLCLAGQKLAGLREA